MNEIFPFFINYVLIWTHIFKIYCEHIKTDFMKQLLRRDITVPNKIVSPLIYSAHGHSFCITQDLISAIHYTTIKNTLQRKPLRPTEKISENI